MIISKFVTAFFKLIFNIFKYIFKLIFKKGFIKKQKEIHLKIHSEEWAKINEDSKSNSPAVLKNTLIRADKSLDNVLKELTSGNTMGERLISGKKLFSDSTYQEIWAAHKVRNSMVHETGYEPTVTILTKSINQLRKGVKELGVKA
jgi:hypothetical protein